MKIDEAMIAAAARVIRDEIQGRLGEATGREMSEDIARLALAAADAALDERLRDAAMANRAGLYRDPARPERECMKCGQPYRGPAVYCSLACATADA